MLKNYTRLIVLFILFQVYSFAGEVVSPTVIEEDFPLSIQPKEIDDIHPLALKLFFGDISDKEPYVIRSVSLNHLLGSNRLAAYKLYSDDGWKIIKSTDDSSYSFKYKAVGEVPAGEIIFLCAESSGSFTDYRYLLCRLTDSDFLVSGASSGSEKVLTLVEAWPRMNSADYLKFKDRHIFSKNTLE